jgi:hypothetical protein
MNDPIRVITSSKIVDGFRSHALRVVRKGKHGFDHRAPEKWFQFQKSESKRRLTSIGGNLSPNQIDVVPSATLNRTSLGHVAD